MQLLRSTWQEYERDYARYYAAAMVFYALIALVPLLLLLLAGLGFLLRHSDLVAESARQFLQAVETGFGPHLRDTVERLSEQLQQGSVVATAISLVGLLVTGSKLFHHLRMMFRAIWKHESPLASGPIITMVWQTFLEKSKAFLVLLASGLLLLLAFVLDGVMHWVAARTSSVPWFGEPVATVLAVVVLLVLAPLTFALLFRYLPPVRLAWRHVRLAAAICGGAWLIGFELFAQYGARFGTQFGAYGALGGVLVAMLWMNVIAQVMFFGAVLCKVISQRDGG
ncbi:YihY/virulence factor BrkB family protein [Ramlibacter sp. G-1-2-2]|uniref:YihY/virulence factor BrkB family protein n=1 Tax=Ramlibacter agri TaxID=2728837 RepID=A0A848HGT5_9BURK|nr:YihY/virulence factor BrkB family protein [Ramlibacter agri]NML47743.1 YihY/virulence factor BrkB family protein [Ramlibacter agri]